MLGGEGVDVDDPGDGGTRLEDLDWHRNMGNSQTLKQVDSKLLEYFYQYPFLPVHGFLIDADQPSLWRLNQSFQNLVLFVTEPKVQEQLLGEVFGWGTVLMVRLLAIYERMLIHGLGVRIYQLLNPLTVCVRLRLLFFLGAAPDDVG